MACDQAVVKLTGYDRKHLLGEGLTAVLSAGDVARVEPGVHAIVHEGPEPTPVDPTLQGTAGPVPSELDLSPLDDGSPEGTVGILREHRGGTTADVDDTEESPVLDVFDGSGVGVVVRTADDPLAWNNEALAA